MTKKYIVLLFALFLFCKFGVAADSTGVSYDAVIHFRSECCGVPDSKAVYDYVTAFRKKYKTKNISVTRYGPLGREGEYDLLFSLNELTNKRKKCFTKGLAKILPTLSGKGMANMEKNISVDLYGNGSRATATTQIL